MSHASTRERRTFTSASAGGMRSFQFVRRGCVDCVSTRVDPSPNPLGPERSVNSKVRNTETVAPAPFTLRGHARKHAFLDGLPWSRDFTRKSRSTLTRLPEFGCEVAHKQEANGD